jgi:hypothetical protein
MFLTYLVVYDESDLALTYLRIIKPTPEPGRGVASKAAA